MINERMNGMRLQPGLFGEVIKMFKCNYNKQPGKKSQIEIDEITRRLSDNQVSSRQRIGNWLSVVTNTELMCLDAVSTKER